MNSKIEKLAKELDINKDKISQLQNRNKELQTAIDEMEAMDLLSLVRSKGYDYDSLKKLINK